MSKTEYKIDKELTDFGFFKIMSELRKSNFLISKLPKVGLIIYKFFEDC